MSEKLSGENVDATHEKQPKLLIVGKYFPPVDGSNLKIGGIESDTLAAATALSNDFDVTVLAHSTDRRGGIEQWPTFRVIRSPTEIVAFSQPISLSHLKWLWRLKPDIIHFHAPNYWAALALQITKPKTKIVVTHHMEVQGRKLLKAALLPMYRALCRRADAVIVSTSKNYRSSSDLPKPLANVHAIPPGMETAPFAASMQPQAAALRASLGVSSMPVVGFLGRAVPYKGLPVLIEALSLCPGVHGLIVGDGPVLDEVKSQTRRLGLEDRISFLGRVASETDKRVALAAMDIFALPSVTSAEAFAIVQVEAQLTGLPVLASSLPTGVSDVTVDGVTGYHVNVGDARDLADKIAVLAGDPDLRARLGQAGRDRAKELYSTERYSQNIRAVFAQVAEGASKAATAIALDPVSARS